MSFVQCMIFFTLSLKGAAATTTIPSSNLATAVNVGNSATIPCNSSGASNTIVWQFTPSSAVTAIAIVTGCVSQFPNVYSITNNATTSHCDLTVISANATLAGQYSCFDTINFQPVNALLTVLDPLVGSQNASYVYGGNTLMTTCDVNYTTFSASPSPPNTPIPLIRWIYSSGLQGVTFLRNSSTTDAFTSIAITVPNGPGSIPSITCEVYFTLTVANPLPANWSSASITISYCPQNVTIENTTQTNTFMCSADSFPPVSVYQWTNNGVAVGSNSQTYEAPSGVAYNISCTVTTYLLGGTSNPCIGTSEFVSGVAAYVSTTIGPTTATTTTNVTTATGQPTAATDVPSPCNFVTCVWPIVLVIVLPVVAAAIIVAVILLYPGSKCYYKTLRTDRHKDQKYKSQANNGSVDTDDASAGMSRQTDQTATYGMEMNTPVSDRSPQYGAGWTGYEAGQQPVIYADLRAPGEPGVTIDNRIGSRTPVQVDNSEYAAVQRA